MIDITWLLREISADYRHRADRIDAAIEAGYGSAYLLGVHSPQIVLKHIKGGLDAEAAILHAARDTGMNAETVKHYWRRWCQDRRLPATQERTAIVMEMAADSMTPHQIARRLGIHALSVNRIIKRALRLTPDRKTSG